MRLVRATGRRYSRTRTLGTVSVALREAGESAARHLPSRGTPIASAGWRVRPARSGNGHSEAETSPPDEALYARDAMLERDVISRRLRGWRLRGNRRISLLHRHRARAL